MICPYKIQGGQECEGAECPVYSPDMACLKTYDFIVYKKEDGEDNDKFTVLLREKIGLRVVKFYFVVDSLKDLSR